MPNPPTPEQIKQARHQLGISQSELAHRLIDATPEQVEVIRNYEAATRRIKLWESGKRTPDRRNTRKLHQIFADLDPDAK